MDTRTSTHLIRQQIHDARSGGVAYLVGHPTTREALIVDPRNADVEEYLRRLSAAGLRLAYALETRADGSCSEAAHKLRERSGCGRIAPADSRDREAERLVAPGDEIKLAGLRIHVLPNTPPTGPDVVYGVGDLRFTGDGIYRDPGERARLGRRQLLEAVTEGLRTGLERGLFSTRERELVEAYLGIVAEHADEAPGADELSARVPGLRRSAVHVLIHGIRRKQRSRGLLPMLLRGQSTKWLRGLQSRPEYTPHEREFLAAYLRLVKRDGRPPTGPQVAAELPAKRSIEWVRKRAHTIRSKQRAFGLPILLLSQSSRQH